MRVNLKQASTFDGVEQTILDILKENGYEITIEDSEVYLDIEESSFVEFLKILDNETIVNFYSDGSTTVVIYDDYVE